MGGDGTHQLATALFAELKSLVYCPTMIPKRLILVPHAPLSFPPTTVPPSMKMIFQTSPNGYTWTGQYKTNDNAQALRLLWRTNRADIPARATDVRCVSVSGALFNGPADLFQVTLRHLIDTLGIRHYF